MLDILILFLLVGGLITGFRRGLLVQVLHMTGFIVSFIVAYAYYKQLADKFVLWIPYPGVTAESKLSWSFGQLDLDETFYRLLAFILIFFVVKFLLQLFVSMFDFLKHLPVLGFISRFFGAALGFVEFYIIILLLISFLALLPVDLVQKLLDSSLLSKTMFEHTPVISDKVKEWWYVYTQ